MKWQGPDPAPLALSSIKYEFSKSAQFAEFTRQQGRKI